MKTIIASGLIVLTAGSALADNVAHVVDIQPIYQTRYNESCQTVTTKSDSSGLLPIILGAGGAAIAHKNIGGGSGKAAATVVGGIVGYELGKSASGGTDNICQRTPYQVRTGQIVTFEYNGYRFTQQFRD